MAEQAKVNFKAKAASINEDYARHKKNNVSQYITAKGTKAMREWFLQLLEQLEFRDARIVKAINTTEGRKQLLHEPLWPGGPVWKDLPPDALPQLHQCKTM